MKTPLLNPLADPRCAVLAVAVAPPVVGRGAEQAAGLAALSQSVVAVPSGGM